MLHYSVVLSGASCSLEQSGCQFSVTLEHRPSYFISKALFAPMSFEPYDSAAVETNVQSRHVIKSHTWAAGSLAPSPLCPWLLMPRSYHGFWSSPSRRYLQSMTRRRLQPCPEGAIQSGGFAEDSDSWPSLHDGIPEELERSLWPPEVVTYYSGNGLGFGLVKAPTVTVMCRQG